MKGRKNKMCKFDKNQSYSTRTVFEALKNKFPEEREESLFPLIGQRFTALKCIPVNKQKKNRFFSGKDCQRVFDYYDEKFCKKNGIPYKKNNDKQVTVFEVLKPKKEKTPSVTLRDTFILEELTRRANYEKIPRNVYLRGILIQYFEEHPWDWSDLEHKTEGLTTREDWLNFIRENYEGKEVN